MGLIDILAAELTGDPEGFGYSGMNNVEAAASLNDTGTGRTLPIDTLTAAQLYEAIDTVEFDALTAAQKTAIDRILGLGGDVILTPASKARAILVAAFGSGTASQIAIVAAVTRTVSRAAEIGLPTVAVGHVQMARM